MTVAIAIRMLLPHAASFNSRLNMNKEPMKQDSPTRKVTG